MHPLNAELLDRRRAVSVVLVAHFLALLLLLLWIKTIKWYKLYFVILHDQDRKLADISARGPMD